MDINRFCPIPPAHKPWETDTPTLISALFVLAASIESEDGVANACIHEAAHRLEELYKKVTRTATNEP
jgi:sirohydrochlorin ferrochelatase